MQKLQLQFQVYVAVAILIFLGLFYIRSLNRQIDNLKQDIARVEELAKDQSVVDRAVTEATDAVTERERDVSEQVARAVVGIGNAPGADQTVPPDVAGAWRSAIVGMRNSSTVNGDTGSHSEDATDAVSGTRTTP